ncbi:hypothetical protein CFC21_007952, partial [Triticum aestivum]|jgi:hypothetical protein
MPPR